MSIMLKNGAVFLHIPKTGGKWVISALEELNLVKFNFSHNHADLERTVNFHRHFPMHFFRQTIKHGYYLNKVKKAYKFCFVRHPLKYYESYFKFAASLGWPETMGKMPGSNNWHPNSPFYGCDSDDFNVFMQNIMSKHPGYVSELYSSFTSPNIDFIGKNENIVEDLIKVLNLMNIDFDQDLIRNHKPKNVSKKPKNPIVWNEKIKNEIIKLEYPALVRYNYL